MTAGGSVAFATEERVMSQKLYVGNLPFKVDETELQQLFSRCGGVESVTIMRDQATGRPRGFGFVEMSSDEDAQKAIDTFDGSDLGGRSLVVNAARPKAARSGGFGDSPRRRRSEPRW